MEFFWSALLLIFSIFFIHRYLSGPRKKLPPSPPSLPIIGHLHLVKPPLHLSLQAFINKYGSIIYLRFGSRPILVVSSPSIAEQCFTKYDVIFANRPKTLQAMYLSYNHTTLVASSYGEHWRNLRRVTTTEAFSSTSIQKSAPMRTEVIRFVVQKLFSGYEGGKRKINLDSLLLDLAYNVEMKLVSGKQWSESYDAFRSLSFSLNVCDYIPMLRWIGYGGIEKNLVEMTRKRDEILQSIVDEGRKHIDENGNTLVQAYLSIQQAQPEYYTDEIIKGMISLMFVAGTGTISLTMQWAMSLLLNHPEVIEKARNQIDEIVAPGRLLEDSDLQKLPYLRCIVNETLRLLPPASLLLPHISSDDCTIEGFDVPKGTILLVNVWAIQRDPNVWKDPTEFIPERFEGHEMGSEGFKFMPFGVGRRVCPGSNLAMRIVSLTIGTFIQCFEWERIGSELVDLPGGKGKTMPKDKPFEAMYKPRSSMINLFSEL